MKLNGLVAYKPEYESFNLFILIPKSVVTYDAMFNPSILDKVT